jgi:signal peptidase I
LFAGVALTALAIRASVLEIYRVVSPSMVPTLNVGDRLLVNRLAYGLRIPFSDHIVRARPPRRGDVIVFPSEAAGGGAGAGPRWLVKRVLGLPGDVVAFRNGSPIVNGWVVPACDTGPFVSTAGTTVVRGRLAVELLEDRAYLTVRVPLDETRLSDYRVPPGEVFVIGDDRGLSSDSRAWNQGRGGSVRISSVVGRVSRLAVGGFRDGRLDLSSVLAPLGRHVREPNVDVGKTEENIGGCLAARRPPSTWPPAPAGR